MDIYVYMYKYIDLGYLGQIVSSKAQFVNQVCDFRSEIFKKKKKSLVVLPDMNSFFFFLPLWFVSFSFVKFKKFLWQFLNVHNIRETI